MMETIRDAGNLSLPAAWRYSGVAVLLHWLLALLIAGMVGLGWYMTAIEDDPGADKYFNLHKSIGIVIFGLVLIRAVWRIGHKPSELPASLPKWEVAMASIIQWLLYGCMILLPVTGFIGALYSKAGIAFFGISLPAWVLPNHDTAEQFFEVHEALAWALVVLVAIHTAAGLKHLLVNRDRVFQRMWF
ncbi:cytochrome b [Noviherbaspirillum soli]|uniref:cytochrome b n=1 Tax=Noviherbaspirillum soli TaxID=1064518 RepID=UPI001E40B679|nr:cytochrome b [Noviherbaspirillum soli]